jgi:hypothetical protein
VTSLAEHFDVVVTILGASLTLIGALVTYMYRQLVCKIEMVSSDRRLTAQEARETKEQLIRLSERLEGYVRTQDRLVTDFSQRMERSDTLHMQLLARMGRLLNGRAGSPIDSASDIVLGEK